MNRRELILSIPAVALARRVAAQAGKPAIPVKAISHFTLAVSDVKRSLDFYQGLFGMPIQARQGSTVVLRMGSGPQFVALTPAGSNAPSIVPTLGMAVENFNADRIMGVLQQHGLAQARTTGSGVVVNDPDGLVILLHDPKYCGGAGTLGTVCTNPEPAPGKGLLAVKDLSHFTINTSDGTRSNAFYRELFGLPIRSRQGAALGLGVGPGVMFIMFAGGGGRGRAGTAPRPASINHVCMNMDNFKPDDVLKTLAGYGISARGDTPGPAGPMKSYVTLRMENRGGAPGGTPELYFTDPDGLLIQLQDASYCGGAGFLGNVCEG